MNPREMTNEQLLDAFYASGRGAGIQNGLVRSMESIAIEYEKRVAVKTELPRRLNELDALRKENEELRRDKARLDFLDDGNYGVDPRNITGVRMDGRRFHCLAGRGDWNTLREAIDAARLAKESEASK